MRTTILRCSSDYCVSLLWKYGLEQVAWRAKSVAQSKRVWLIEVMGARKQRGNRQRFVVCRRFVTGRFAISRRGTMGSKVGALPLLLAGFLLASCASPRGLDEPPLQLPPLKAGYGRVYFTRPADLGGSAVQPEIRMNNEVVGRSVPGGFSFVDRPPGKYAVTTATEVENAVTFQLAAGETKYIRTSVTPGILVGHITPTLEFPEQGQSDISQLRYVGPAF